jgi:hypothetical protein
MTDSRGHHVVDLEMPARVVDELPIARMVDRFHCHDPFHEPRSMSTDMLHQFSLLVGWAGDEDHPGIRERVRDALKEPGGPRSPCRYRCFEPCDVNGERGDPGGLPSYPPLTS